MNVEIDEQRRTICETFVNPFVTSSWTAWVADHSLVKEQRAWYRHAGI